MTRSTQMWMLWLLLAPLYGALTAAACSWALLTGLPAGVAVLGPADLAWRHVYALGLAALLTVGPLVIAAANQATSRRRAIEALVMTALLMQLIAWWTLMSPVPSELEGFFLAANALMKGQAQAAASWAWILASGLLPFTLVRDDLRRGALGYGGAALFSVVPAILLTPPDPISTVLALGTHLVVATLGLGIGALVGWSYR